MMMSCTCFNTLFYGTEISSIDSDCRDIRAIALQLGVPNPDDQRSKVDRQKLENMIKTDSETKTKKDSHVRLVEKPEDVLRAKERVLSSLDCRGTKVIMKMDVSYTAHSYIIGSGGNNIKYIMEKTATSIHFPDSNCMYPTKKSNEVSLRGSLEGVEKARSLIRSSFPLVISFELPIMAPGRSAPNNETPYIKEVETGFNVQVIFSKRVKLHTWVVLVKGSENEATRVQMATQLLINFIWENNPSQIPVHMELEISPQHHDIVKGKSNNNILDIMQRTKTTIIFQDVNDCNINPMKKSQVTITGSIDDVYVARQQLIGNLPIVLTFIYPESSADTREIVNLSKKHGVFISLMQKRSTMTVVIKGVEKYIDKIYEARHEVLKLTTPLIKPEISASYFSPKDQEITYRRSLTSLLSYHPESHLTPGFPITPTSYPSTYQNLNVYQKFQGTPAGICGNNRRYLQSHAQAQVQVQAPQAQTNFPHIQPNNCNLNKNFLTIPIPCQMRKSLSPRSSNACGYQSFSTSTSSLKQGYTYNNNWIPSASAGQCSPDSTFNHDNKGRRFSDGRMQCGQIASGNDFRTPTYDMKNNPFDFDMNRVDGYKAMERQPHDEVRTPTSSWPGLGLSRTVPSSMDENEQKSWERGQASPYNLEATTGIVDATTANRRIHKDIQTSLASLRLEHIYIPAADSACNNAMPSSNQSPRFSGSAAPRAERRTSFGW